MEISVIIPTCNRKKRLLLTLDHLNKSSQPLAEVIIVDSGTERLTDTDYKQYKNLRIQYLGSEQSVCIQRNKGIGQASSSWILLCDDDVEVPPDYLQKLIDHIDAYPEAGAVSGLFLQQEKDEWTAQYPIHSNKQLRWTYFFKLGIWGSIECDNKKLKRYYQQKGNHIAKSGWPVLTDFSGEYFVTPLYSLGAMLVKRDWLVTSPFDEVLDPYGMGDNYGVAAGFPTFIHVLNNAFVYHHREPANRLMIPLQYFRRMLALDYFGRTKSRLGVKKRWILWSLMGNLLSFIYAGKGRMIKASVKLLFMITFNRNPYTKGKALNKKTVQPQL